MTSEPAPAPRAPRGACDLVLLVDLRGDILGFDPQARSLQRLARASCDFGGDTGPRAMAVDPDGTLWMGAYDGRVLKVRVLDGRCERTDKTLTPKLDLTTARDTLWGADELGLFTLDRESLKESRTTMKGAALLAGAADGRLFGQSGRAIVRVDTEKKTMKNLVAIDQPAPMAFHRGALYLFQGAEGLTRDNKTAGALRGDVSRDAGLAFEPVLEVVEHTFVSAGSAQCPP